MKTNLVILFILFSLSSIAQVGKQNPPSYFGLQVRPIFPTNFIGDSELKLSKDGFESTLSKKVGYSFGATVRVGLTKTLALETGINYTQRQYNQVMSVADSNSFATNTLTFVEYDIPLNALVYIKLADSWFMNASVGFALTYKPTDVETYNAPGGNHSFTHIGLTRSKVGIDANANIGFEFRTEKDGFFYLGASARVPFAPVFDYIAQYHWEDTHLTIIGEFDASFMSVDFKYFFPNIKNKGPQFIDGPIL